MSLPLAHEGYAGSTDARARPSYAAILATLFGLLWLALAVAPHDRSDWLLENALTLAAVGALTATARRFPLARVSYTLIFVFLCLHAVGAHYRYSEVPYDAGWKALTGSTLNEHLGWERNNFDRVVHFAYGLLLAYPIRELFLRIVGVRGFWGYLLTLELIMSTSMLYELIEWLAAEVVGGELGAAYLGAQGDVWDAHKDMALATLGALLSMCLTALVSARFGSFGTKLRGRTRPQATRARAQVASEAWCLLSPGE